MPTKIQLRRGEASDWTDANPTLAEGELGIELDTGKFKFGDGTTAWNDLAYVGGGSPGIWKLYGEDSSNDWLGGITLGNGLLEGRWWTPAPVIPSSDTPHFICVVEAYFQMGSTSTIDSTFSFHLPHGVDGSEFNMEPVFTTQIGVAYADQGGNYMGLAFGGGVGSPDGTSWDASTPEVWATPHLLRVNSMFLARFTGD